MYDFQSIVAFKNLKGRHKLVLDANLLILLFVGLLDPEHIENCNRLSIKSGFTKEDFSLLVKILENFDPEIIISPHVLTELSNMSKNSMGLGEKKEAYFNLMINRLKNFHEEHITLSELLGLDLEHVIKFGVSDLGVIETAKKLDAVILSRDFNMVNHARSKVPWVINFNNIRTAATGF